MEMLSFYWPNLIAACFLVWTLGVLGQHLLVRNQSMEIMLLGQEFQTGILIAAIFMNFYFGDTHSEHGFHIESLVTLVLVFIFHSFYSLLLKKFRSFRIEGAILAILVLIGLTHVIVLLSPVVEFHMVKSAIGDIVTVSRSEALFVTFMFFIMTILLFKNTDNILQDSIELGLFNRVVGRRKSYLIFSIVVYVAMLLSIHLFGTLFTLGSMLIPAFVSSIRNIPRKLYKYLLLTNVLMVGLSFSLMTFIERFPTTVLIIFTIFTSNAILSFFLQKKIKQI